MRDYTGQPLLKRSVILIGSLAVIALLAYGVYAVLGNKPTDSVKQQAVETPAYQTYSDSDIKLSFEYPSKWRVGSEVDEVSGSKYITVYSADNDSVAQLVLDAQTSVPTGEKADVQILESKPLTIATKDPSYAVYGVYKVEEDYLPIFGVSSYGADVAGVQVVSATLIEPRDVSKYRTIRFELLFDGHFHDMAEAKGYFTSNKAQALYRLFQSLKLG